MHIWVLSIRLSRKLSRQRSLESGFINVTRIQRCGTVGFGVGAITYEAQAEASANQGMVRLNWC